ncbi:cytochrome c oxidase subunit 3 [Colwellia sp. 12G3]|uniref:cytochrome c oxidase subunit 3 n=1 Tax=Colwellia sp. 12G3 TaxID=2058299 RepID=UPI000C348681|nr:cytochrome c oxidase subunit 3 [Colwellia sp. 12G3]PKI16189.1 cytochrome C oxidase subunit III [Colwellia sp. 12G3]
MSDNNASIGDDPKIRMTGEAGVWGFIIGDMMLFSTFFISYCWDRSNDQLVFLNAQQALNQTFGVINTLLLLTGSLFVVLALHSARKAMSTTVTHMLLAAIICGCCFIGSKVIEYTGKIQDGYSLLTNDFFMYYFMLTAIHLLHVIIGIGVLLYLWDKSREPSCNITFIQHLESGGAVWHMVDLLWLVLFPLLYLVK